MLLTFLKNIVVTPSPREITWPLRALAVLKDPGLGSQHTHGVSQPCITQVPEDSVPSSGFQGHFKHIHTCREKHPPHT